jgi:hypothetical protein
MRFTLRDLLWLTALVAAILAWRLDVWRHDYSIRSAQMRKDYYNAISEFARAEGEKARAKQQELSEALQKLQQQPLEQDRVQ